MIPRQLAAGYLIGEPKLWGKEIGEAAIGLIEEYLKNNTEADIICADSATDNGRALRFWRKAGFKPVELIEDYDHRAPKSILMVKALERC